VAGEASRAPPSGLINPRRFTAQYLPHSDRKHRVLDAEGKTKECLEFLATGKLRLQ